MHDPTSLQHSLHLGRIRLPDIDAVYKGTMSLILFQVISALPSPGREDCPHCADADTEKAGACLRLYSHGSQELELWSSSLLQQQKHKEALRPTHLETLGFSRVPLMQLFVSSSIFPSIH